MFQAEKKALRATMKQKLAAMSDEERRIKSAAIQARLTKLKMYRKAATVMAYASFGAEVSTDALLEQILNDGKTLALPRLNPFDNTLVPHRVTDLANELVANRFGIREPRPDLPVLRLEEIHLVLVPGLAFDESGNRLGRGLGCYDKLIFEASVKTDFVALGFKIQTFDELDIPINVHDMPVDLIITESNTIEPGSL